MFLLNKYLNVYKKLFLAAEVSMVNITMQETGPEPLCLKPRMSWATFVNPLNKQLKTGRVQLTAICAPVLT